MPTLISPADARALKSILVQPWLCERSRLVRWLLRALAPIAALVFVIAWRMTGRIESGGFAALMLLAALVSGIWITFARALALHNTPVNALLVPRARRLSLWLLPLTCLLLAALLAGLAASMFGHFGLLLAAFVIGLFGMAMMASGAPEGLLVFLAADFSITNGPRLAAMLDSIPFSSLGCLLLAGGVCVYASHRIFPHGGERHWKRQASNELSRAMAAGEVEAVSKLSGPGPLISRVYGAVLRRDCQRRASRQALLMHVLGPSVHWSRWLASLVLIGAGVAVVLAILTSPWLPVGASDLWSGMIAGGVIITSAFVALLAEQAFGKRLASTVTEQSLLCLAPNLPRGRALNRLLAARMLLQSTGAILMALLLSWCVGMAARIPPEPLLAMMALASTSLVLLPAVLRNVAAMGNPMHIGRSMLLVLVIGAMCCASIGLRIAYDMPWPWLIATSVVLGLFVARLRWRIMVDAPAAFPAGRLA